MVILAIRHIYLHFIMTYTYIISIEFSHMMNDYMVHMVHRITTRTDTALARLTSSSSARRPASRRRRQHTGHHADTYIYAICIHMHVYIRRGAPLPSFAHAFLCIRWSTAALVHPCVQTYIRRSGAPPLSSHRPLSRPSRSTFILSLSLTLNNHTRANRTVDVTDVVRPSHQRNSPSAVYV